MKKPEKTILEKQKRLCKDYNLDFKSYQAINKKILKLSSKKILTTYIRQKMREVVIRIGINLDYHKEIHKITSEKNNLNPKQKSLLQLFLYLQTVEGIFTKVVQAIGFLLIKNDHDIYNPIHMKFAKKYTDLNEIPLFVKIQFLKKHGFSSFTSAVDRKLRNCIAHLEFSVKDDGTIINLKNKQPITNLDKKIDQLGSACTIVILSFAEILKPTLSETIEHAIKKQESNTENSSKNDGHQ